MNYTCIKDNKGNWWIYEKSEGIYSFVASYVNKKLLAKNTSAWRPENNFTEKAINMMRLNENYEVSIIDDDELNKLIKEAV